jgi:hypothetical protein
LTESISKYGLHVAIYSVWLDSIIAFNILTPIRFKTAKQFYIQYKAPDKFVDGEFQAGLLTIRTNESLYFYGKSSIKGIRFNPYFLGAGGPGKNAI